MALRDQFISLYVGEYDLDGYAENYHCLLAFASASDPDLKATDILGYAHFTNPNGRVALSFHDSITLGFFRHTTFFPVVTIKGKNDIFERLEFLRNKFNNQSPFYFGNDFRSNPMAVNCRTGVRDLLYLLTGSSLLPEQVKQISGMHAPNIFAKAGIK